MRSRSEYEASTQIAAGVEFRRPRHHIDVSRIPRCRATRSFWGRVWAALYNWL